MTVYEALVQAQHEACETVDFIEKVLVVQVCYAGSLPYKMQSAIDRAYLLGVAIDNLPADVASREV